MKLRRFGPLWSRTAILSRYFLVISSEVIEPADNAFLNDASVGVLSVSEMVADNSEVKSVLGVASEFEKAVKQAKSPKADNALLEMWSFRRIIVFNLQRTQGGPITSQSITKLSLKYDFAIKSVALGSGAD